MEQAPSPASAPQASAERTPDWPPWFGPVAFVGALVCTLVSFGVIAAILGIEEGDDTPALVIVVTLLQYGFFLGAAYLFARSVAPPRAWHFGLRQAPLWSTVGWAALGMLTFYVLTAIYSALVDPTAEQEVTDSLGAGDGTAGLVAAGVMVIVVAPFVEETFFRGFFYRALRTRYPILLAAIVDGLVFGAIHYGFDGADGLLILPPLALLGAIFCLVYEKTGTLWATIGLHSLNNAIAFSAQANDYEGWQVAVVAGPLMLAACVLVPRLMRSGPPALPPARARPGAQLSLPVE